MHNWMFIFLSLNATINQNPNIGRSVDEIFKNLLQIGQMYTMELSDDGFDKMELMHTVLSNVYNGSYPIWEIMTKVIHFH